MKIKINSTAHIITERTTSESLTVKLILTASGRQINSKTINSTDTIKNVLIWAKNRLNRYKSLQNTTHTTILGAKTIQFAPLKTDYYNTIFNN